MTLTEIADLLDQAQESLQLRGRNPPGQGSGRRSVLHARDGTPIDLAELAKELRQHAPL
jgi:hypothetical protein